MTQKNLKPILNIIAGPNGSGKTTFTDLLLQHEWADGCIFINPDQIAQSAFGDWNSSEAVIKAANRAKEIREQCLAERASMVLETVFSTDEKIDFIRRAKKTGFFIRFFFIGTDSPEINASRVAKRVIDGGHDVPITKIISRYYRSIANCGIAAALVDRAYVYDNSVEDVDPQKLFRTKDGQVYKRYAGLIQHEWAKMILEELEHMVPPLAMQED